MSRVSTRTGPVQRWALVLFAVFTGLTLFGYGFYGLNPGRIPSSEFARAVFRGAFQGFAQAHIVLSFAVLATVLLRHARLLWVPAFVAVCTMAFLAEHVGTGYGIPFGGYEYTGLLGVKVGGRVPALIPASWFIMALPSFVLARRSLPGRGFRGGRILVASLLLVSWDLALDPAMSYMTSYWRWEEPGPFYGMPLENLAGWLLTGLVLMTALELSNGNRWIDRLPVGWSAGFYLTVLALPLGMCLAAGLWGVLFATVAGLALTAGVAGSLAVLGYGSDSRGVSTVRAAVKVGS